MDLPRRLRQKDKRVSKATHSPGRSEQSISSQEEVDNDSIVEIAAGGDVVLAFEHTIGKDMKGKAINGTSNGVSSPARSGASNGEIARNGVSLSKTSVSQYRTSLDHLRNASPYFKMLLDPDKFEEGRSVATKHKGLLSKHTGKDQIPAEELPQILIKDIGRISAVKSIRLLVGDFLRVLHGQEMSNAQPPLTNIANLCVVADRFDALPAVKQYFKTRRILHLDGKTPGAAVKAPPEEKTRQRLLVGLLLDNPSWIWHASLRLVQQGWVDREVSEDSALWWDLPMGIEDELLFRRECILETIQSLQTYFLCLYTSRDRQCRLGYDSSAECDVYQLGQMIRFFKKINTLSLAGTILPFTDLDTDQEPYQDDLISLIDSLRQCPEYQIDKNHQHCGLRARLMTLLDTIEYSLTEVGICMNCWQENRHEYAWSQVKRPLIWRKDNVGSGMVAGYKSRQAQSHMFKHIESRDMFMAKERIWTRRLDGVAS